MTYLALIILITLIIIGFILIFLGFPGTIAIFLGILAYDILMVDFSLGVLAYGILAFLILLGELFDIFVASLIAKRFKTSNWGIAGMIIGGILGAILGSSVPVIGNLIGLLIGGAIGTMVVELILRKNFSQAVRATTGAILGRAGAILLKAVIGIAMLLFAFIVTF